VTTSLSLSSAAVSNQPLAELDPEIAAVLAQELGRQRGTLEMIASENFAPRAVMEAQGSVLTNKYAEGYPKKRWYGGCEFVDVAEQLAFMESLMPFLALLMSSIGSEFGKAPNKYCVSRGARCINSS